MNALTEIKNRFSSALSELVDDNPESLLSLIRPAQDAKFGDYQANCAMPLGKKLSKPPRDVAAELVEKISVDDFCSKVEIAGPGFINLTLDDQWLKQNLTTALTDERLGIAKTTSPRKFVVDYSSPNVAKPMHVGHIRSTVIGDALSKILRFVGHDVISDNHLGDWGTQFGMIIYGYKNFAVQDDYDKNPIGELGRLYKYVRKIMDYHAAIKKKPDLMKALEGAKKALAEMESQQPPADKSEAKKFKKNLKKTASKVKEMSEAVFGKKNAETGILEGGLDQTIEMVESNPSLKADAGNHPEISVAVLTETAKLHEGDAENKKLWEEFLPHCLDDINRIYKRLDIEFDHILGESHYHPLLADVVNSFVDKGFARPSEGAMCVFMENYDTPMIIQKKDGAFLYSTTDLATIKYRMDEWAADAMLYVVDHRQHEHFEKLFDAAKLWGYNESEMTHVSFGTVMGKDGKPFKTRSGDTVGLEGLLDEAESRAMEIAIENNPELDDDRKKEISTVVGLGGLKYADLSHNRESDYVFDYDKMLAQRGNSATYLQYGYARVQGILRKTEASVEALRANPVEFIFEEEVERKLALQISRFGETLDEVLVEYKPNLLCSYLFELAQTFAQFFSQCSVKDAATEELKSSRVQLIDLTARTLKTGLGLLGIRVLDKM